MTQRFRFVAEDYPRIDSPEYREKFLRNLNQLAERVTKGLGTNGISLENLNAEVKSLEVKTRDEWIALSLTNGWTAYGAPFAAPAYRWNAGAVELRGLVVPGAGVIATLPVEARPGATLVFPRAVDTGPTTYNTPARLDVQASGAIVATNSPAGMLWMPLDGVRLAAAGPSAANPAFPVRFKTKVSGKPAGIVILGAQDATTSGRETPVSLGSPAWSVSKDQIVIHDIAGVLAGRNYRVNLLVLGA
jgi:hypothetical protein